MITRTPFGDCYCIWAEANHIPQIFLKMVFPGPFVEGCARFEKSSGGVSSGS